MRINRVVASSWAKIGTSICLVARPESFAANQSELQYVDSLVGCCEMAQYVCSPLERNKGVGRSLVWVGRTAKFHRASERADATWFGRSVLSLGNLYTSSNLTSHKTLTEEISRS
jgi:hypothetical protein